MAAVRAVLIASMIFFLAASPLVLSSVGGSSPESVTAYAAPPIGGTVGTDVMQNGNNNNNNNGNGNHRHGENPDKTGLNDNGNNNNNNNNGNNNNNNNNGNDNGGNDNGGNDNGDDGNDNGGDGNGNGNDNDPRSIDSSRGGGRSSFNARGSVSKCFDVEEVGVLQLILDNGDVTFLVPPNSGYPAITRVTLRDVSVSSVPAPPAGSSFVGNMVWEIIGLNGCAGPSLGVLGAHANLGITYRASADKSKIRIMRLVNGQWTEVNTVPDPIPANPYVSTSTHDVGIYTLMVRP
jgi:hypothetical protein